MQLNGTVRPFYTASTGTVPGPSAPRPAAYQLSAAAVDSICNWLAQPHATYAMRLPSQLEPGRQSSLPSTAVAYAGSKT